MSDVQYRCARCGGLSEFSEYAAGRRRCPSCGSPSLQPVATPPAPAVGLASLGKDDGLNGQPIAHREGEAAVRQVGVTRTRAEAAARLRREHLPSMGLGLLVFLLYGAPLAALLYASRTSSRWQDVYLQLRWTALALPFVVVVVEGFRESRWRGFLCLLFPPYFLWHALTRVESYWRQTLVLGGLALLAAEYIWFNDISVVVRAEARVARGIERVGHLIYRPGDAGELR